MPFFFFQAEDGIRDYKVTGVQTCALPISTITIANAMVEKTGSETDLTDGFINYARSVDGVEVAASFRERSEEHTSELQSPCNLVCRLLLEKKKKKQTMLSNT